MEFHSDVLKRETYTDWDTGVNVNEEKKNDDNDNDNDNSIWNKQYDIHGMRGHNLHQGVGGTNESNNLDKCESIEMLEGMDEGRFDELDAAKNQDIKNNDKLDQELRKAMNLYYEL